MEKQFKEWWGKASKTLKCDQYDAYEIWQQAQKQAIPDGFVLVPREPTPKMIDSTWDYDEDIREMSSNTRNEFIYKTMIKEGEIK